MMEESPVTESERTEATSSADAFAFPFTTQTAGRSTRADRRRTPSIYLRYRICKRMIDVLLILLAAPLLLPALLMVALLVRFSSPGPIFFSHRRICRGGAFFSMRKFRTMCVNSAEVLEQYLSQNPDARAEWNKLHKLRHDPRITPVGRFLRRSSLDELPQVWNVLSGRMSLVGPRPIVAAEVQKYGEYFDCYCRVKPGVTGLWQVSGRSTLSYDARVQLDCDYVRHWSLSRDLLILVQTVRSVVNTDGAF
jgi:lipopolysaccharide/colanic/teichoic acid biosynthesis glycosyltransferase